MLLVSPFSPVSMTNVNLIDLESQIPDGSWHFTVITSTVIRWKISWRYLNRKWGDKYNISSKGTTIEVKAEVILLFALFQTKWVHQLFHQALPVRIIWKERWLTQYVIEFKMTLTIKHIKPTIHRPCKKRPTINENEA